MRDEIPRTMPGCPEKIRLVPEILVKNSAGSRSIVAVAMGVVEDPIGTSIP